MEVTSSSLVPLIWLPSAWCRGLRILGECRWSTNRARYGGDGLTGAVGGSIFRVCIRLTAGVGGGDAAVVCFCALVAQLDRASDYGSEGWGFEFLQAHGR